MNNGNKFGANKKSGNVLFLVVNRTQLLFSIFTKEKCNSLKTS